MEVSVLLGVVMALLSVAVAVLFCVRCRSERKLHALASAGWLTFALHATMGVLGVSVELREIFVYFFALFVTLYIVFNVLEFSPSHSRLFWIYALIPLSHVLYRLLDYSGFHMPARLGGLSGDSGVMLLLTAYVAYRAFGQALVSLSLVPMAVALLLYKFLRGTVFGFSLMFTGTIIFAFSSIRVLSVRFFRNFSSEGVPSLSTFRGLFLLEPPQLMELQKEYSEYPVLLITRRYTSYPERWTVFYLASVDMQNSIKPTSLERLGHVIIRYLSEAKNAGFRGVVVLDALDYLLLYNEPTALLKFLSNVRDYAIVSDGVIFVVVDESLDRNLRVLLERIGDGKIVNLKPLADGTKVNKGKINSYDD